MEPIVSHQDHVRRLGPQGVGQLRPEARKNETSPGMSHFCVREYYCSLLST